MILLHLHQGGTRQNQARIRTRPGLRPGPDQDPAGIKTWPGSGAGSGAGFREVLMTVAAAVALAVLGWCFTLDRR